MATGHVVEKRYQEHKTGSGGKTDSPMSTDN